jgi:hypothetical protein
VAGIRTPSGRKEPPAKKAHNFAANIEQTEAYRAEDEEPKKQKGVIHL